MQFSNHVLDPRAGLGFADPDYVFGLLAVPQSVGGEDPASLDFENEVERVHHERAKDR